MPDPVKVEARTTSKILGRHTRLSIPFKWRDVNGEFINLQEENYTARVWVKDANDTVIGDGIEATIDGTKAVYHMRPEDLTTASPANNKPVLITCVAENNDNTLPPNPRAIVVGEWGGADEYQPAD